MKNDIKKVVLAYSGGLDTSIIIPWLKENYGCEIITFTSNVGQEEELTGLKEKALASGADKVYIENMCHSFVADYIFPVLKAGAIYEGRYLLGTSFARPLAAKRQVEIAEIEGADAVAHGCTGKGNDQVRFELTYKAINPKLKVIAPWREWDLKSREDEIAYAKAKNIPITVSAEKPYSNDANLWHRSIEGGVLENPWNECPEDAYLYTKNPMDAPDEPDIIEIDFKEGVPVGLNGLKLSPVKLLVNLNNLASKHGVGRVDIVENRLVGMKSRGVYETPGGTVLFVAHQDLEALVLDSGTLHFKQMISHTYADLVYNGLWFTPLREALDAFVNETQKTVTGTVRLRLYKGNVTVLGRKSSYSLYREDYATFGEDHVYNQKDAEGFINLLGLPLKVRAMLRNGGVKKQMKLSPEQVEK
jgi:argininosuccinate synthase